MRRRHKLVQRIDWNESSGEIVTGRTHCNVCGAAPPEHPARMQAQQLEEWYYDCPGPDSLEALTDWERERLEEAFLEARVFARTVQDATAIADRLDELHMRAQFGETESDLAELAEFNRLAIANGPQPRPGSAAEDIVRRTTYRPPEGAEEAPPSSASQRELERAVIATTPVPLPIPIRGPRPRTPLPPWRKR